MCKKFFILLLILFLCQGCRLFHGSLHLFHKKNTLTTFNQDDLDQLFKMGFSYLGVPYRVGGTDKNGLDCSGLLFTMYQSSFFQIPRTTSQQLEFGLPVSINQIQRGDWVFFSNPSGMINHVGIVSNIKKDSILFLHASTSKGVREDELLKGYWHNSFAKAIRPFKQIKF
jgi:cell wall-associated NlpC family hydrolase